MRKIVFLLLISLFFSNQAISQAPPPAPVVVVEVEERQVKTPVTFVGEVGPIRRSLVASEIEGLVDSFSASEGKLVEKGEMLAKFRTKSLEIDLAEARASKREAQARYNLADKNYRRFSELHKKGIASLQELQDAESEKSAFVARKAQLQAQIESNKYDIQRSIIRAPFRGYITEEHTEVGQWVNEGGPIVELVDISRLKIKVDVPERHISKISKNDSVKLSFDALEDKKVEGKVSSIVPQADLEARTFPVEVEIENENNIVKSGMVARMSFMIGDASMVKLVPKDAIVNQGGNMFVYVVNEGVVNPVPVKAGIAYEDLLQVIGPLQKGQLVVTRGNERLRPQQPVKIVNKNEVPDA